MYIIFILLFLFFLVALPFVLVKPDLASKLTKGLVQTREKALVLFGGAFLVFFILAVATTPPQTNIPEQEGVKGDSVEATLNPVPVAAEPSASTMTVISATPMPTQTPTPTIKPTSTQKPATPKPTATPKPATPAPTHAAVVAPSSYSTPTNGGDKDCPDFSTQAEAQRYFNAKGGSPTNNVDRLDADNDGIPCENLP